MCKIKKSMAVLLSALMLASFMPLFASAATITLNSKNIIILEAPKITYGEQAEVNKITVDYGVSPKDLTVTGGKLGYVASEGATPVEVPGTFSGASTIKLSVGDDIAIRLKFTPTDTTTYSSPTISNTYTMAEGVVWPTAKVIGQSVTLVEAPTPAATKIGLGNNLTSAARLSGGKVTDADGNEVSGTWSYVNNRIMDTEGTFEEQIQWYKAGYEKILSTVTITVKMFKTSLAEKPTMSAISVNSLYGRSSVTGGKILDDENNEVTGGTWKVTYPEGFAANSYAYSDLDVTLTWTKTGYEAITTTATIPVNQTDANFNFVSGAYIKETTVEYAPDKKISDIVTLVPGVITDKNGNEVKGTYEIYRDSGCTATDISIGTNKVVYIKFTADDTSLGSFLFYDSLTVTKASFEITEDFEIVLNYGAKYRMPLQAKDLTFSNLSVTPANDYTNVYTIYWSLDEFDPKTADYGSVTYVNATITPEFANIYNTLTNVRIPVRIQNYQIANVFAVAGSELGAYIASGEGIEDADEGIITYTVNFTNARLKGEVKVSATDGTDTFDVATVTPDETGKFYVLDKWQAPADGDYTFTYTYIPSEEDTASFTDEKYLTVNALKAVSVDMKEFRTITVKVGSDVFTQKVREGKAFWIEWEDLTDTDPAAFDHWVITDANGKECTAKSRTGGDFDTTDKTVNIVVGATDLTFTAATASGDTDMDSASGGALGSLWDFWQKLINFIIEIYTQIMNVFVPSVEQGW